MERLKKLMKSVSVTVNWQGVSSLLSAVQIGFEFYLWSVYSSLSGFRYATAPFTAVEEKVINLVRSQEPARGESKKSIPRKYAKQERITVCL